MADKIYNIGDYRKPADPPGATTDTIEGISIEDPLNFLDASEKEAYIRERHREEAEKERRIEEREHEASAAARALPEEERKKIKRETDDPLGDRPVRRRPDPQPAHDRDARPRYADRRRENVRNWEPEDDEDDEDEGNGIIIASAILGILIMVVAVFLGWMTFFGSQHEEPEAEERALQEAQKEENEKDTEEEPEEEDESETDEIDYAILPEGFELCNDTVVTTTQLNIRSAPDSSDDTNIVTAVREGTKLTRVAVSETIGWSAVYVDGHDEILFCSNKYIEEE